MRCGIYVRVSTDDQRDNGYSIDSQLRMIKEYCEKNDYWFLLRCKHRGMLPAVIQRYVHLFFDKKIILQKD